MVDYKALSEKLKNNKDAFVKILGNDKYNRAVENADINLNNTFKSSAVDSYNKAFQNYSKVDPKLAERTYTQLRDYAVSSLQKDYDIYEKVKNDYTAKPFGQLTYSNTDEDRVRQAMGLVPANFDITKVFPDGAPAPENVEKYFELQKQQEPTIKSSNARDIGVRESYGARSISPTETQAIIDQSIAGIKDEYAQAKSEVAPSYQTEQITDPSYEQIVNIGKNVWLEPNYQDNIPEQYRLMVDKVILTSQGQGLLNNTEKEIKDALYYIGKGEYEKANAVIDRTALIKDEVKKLTEQEEQAVKNEPYYIKEQVAIKNLENIQDPNFEEIANSFEFVGGDTLGSLTDEEQQQRFSGQGVFSKESYTLPYSTPEQRKVYAYYVQTGQEEKAKEYLKLIKRQANAERTREFEETVQKASESPAGDFVLGVTSVPMNLLSGTSLIGTGIDMLSDKPVDPNAFYNAPAQYVSGARGAVTQDMSDAGKFWTNLGFSTADFAMAYLATGGSAGLGKTAGKYLTSSLMASEAGGQTAYDVIQRGGTAGEAFLSGTLVGGVEAATELITLGALDEAIDIARKGGNVTQFLKQTLKTAGSEGGEELISEIGGNIVDIAVNGDNSSFEIYVRELMANGVPEIEARQQATFKFFGKDVALAFASGFISGGVMGGGVQISQMIKTEQDVQAAQAFIQDLETKIEETPNEKLKEELTAVKEEVQEALDNAPVTPQQDITAVLPTTQVQTQGEDILTAQTPQNNAETTPKNDSRTRLNEKEILEKANAYVDEYFKPLNEIETDEERKSWIRIRNKMKEKFATEQSTELPQTNVEDNQKTDITDYVGMEFDDGKAIHKVTERTNWNGEDVYLVSDSSKTGVYADIIPIDQMKTYVGYWKQDLVDNAKYEQEQAKREKEEADKQTEYEDVDGFADNLAPYKTGQILKILNKKFNYEGEGVKTRKQYIRDHVDAEYFEDDGYYGFWVDKKAKVSRPITKTEYDYAQYLKENRTDELNYDVEQDEVLVAPIEVTHIVSEQADQLNEQILSDTLKDSKFKETAMKNLNSRKLSESFKNDLEELIAVYPTTDNKTQKKIASEFVTNNKTEAENYINESEILQTAADSAIVMELVERYRYNGEFDKALDMIMQTAIKFSKAGQIVQSAAIWKLNTPEGIVKAINTALTKANTKAKSDIQLDENTAKEIMQDAEKMQTASAQELADMFLKWCDMRNRRLGEQSKAFLQRYVDTNNIDILKDCVMKAQFSYVLDKVPRSIGRKISTIQAFTHLLNVRTYLRNIIANKVFRKLDTGADIFAAPIDMLMKIKTQQRSVAMPKPSLTVTKLSYQGAKLGKQRANFEIDTGIRLSDEQGKYELFGNETFTGDKAFNRLEKLLGRELRTPDQKIKGAIEITEIAKQLQLQDIDIKNHTVEELYQMADEETLKLAGERALYEVFQDDSFPARMLDGLKKYLNKVGINNGEFGLGDLLIKYTRVPGNIIQRGIDFTPLGSLKLIKYLGQIKSIKKNGLTRTQQQDIARTLGRSLMGSTVIFAATMLAKAGIIVGTSSDDKEDKFLKSMGVTNGSINVSAIGRLIKGESTALRSGDMVVSIDFLETINLPLALGYMFSKFDDGTTAGEAAKLAVNTSVEEITDLPMMQVINSIFYEAQKTDANAWDIALVPFKQAIPGFVPAPIRQAATSSDTTQRERDTFFDNIKAGIPGARQTLEPKLDAFGNPMEENVNVIESIVSFFNPGTTSVYDAPDFTDELLWVSEMDDAVIPTGKPVTDFKLNGEEYVLDAKQQTDFMQEYGDRLEEEYRKILESDLYDSQKVDALIKAQTDIKNDVKREFALEINPPDLPDVLIDLYKETGKDIFLLDDETFKKDGVEYEYPVDWQEKILDELELDTLDLDELIGRQDEIADEINDMMSVYESYKNKGWSRFDYDDVVIDKLITAGVKPIDVKSYNGHVWTDAEKEVIANATYVMLKNTKWTTAEEARAIMEQAYKSYKQRWGK